MKKIVCMGDSITEGFGLDEGHSYPDHLQQMLGENSQVINKCVTCSTVLNVTLDGEAMGFPYVRQARYAEALAEQGDVYVILLGTNDAQDGMDDVKDIRYELCNMISRKGEFQGCYQRILDDVKKAAPNAQIYMGIPVPVMQCIWRKHQEKYLQELMPYYEALLAANPGVKKIDVHGAFMGLSETERQALYQEDNLHPNEAGATLIAKTVCRALTDDSAVS